MRYRYITKIKIKFDKKKTFKRKSIKYLQKFIFQESVKLPALVEGMRGKEAFNPNPSKEEKGFFDRLKGLFD